jgi:hypothetical protein
MVSLLVVGSGVDVVGLEVPALLASADGAEEVVVGVLTVGVRVGAVARITRRVRVLGVLEG